MLMMFAPIVVSPPSPKITPWTINIIVRMETAPNGGAEQDRCKRPVLLFKHPPGLPAPFDDPFSFGDVMHRLDPSIIESIVNFWDMDRSSALILKLMMKPALWRAIKMLLNSGIPQIIG